MTNSSKKALAKGAAFAAALGACIALATAPVGIPILHLLKTFTFPDFNGHLEAYESPMAFIDYIGTVVSGKTGRGYALEWLAIIEAMVAIVCLVESISKPGRIVKKGSPLGESRIYESRRDLLMRNLLWKGEGVPRNPGLVLSSSRKGYLYDGSIPHWLIVGKTGAGKGQLLLPSVHLFMAAGWNLVVTGKPEMWELTADAAHREGYDHIIIDLGGGASDSFNPIDIVASFAEQGLHDEAQKSARQVANDFVKMGGESNSYFPRAARSALAAFILAVAYEDIPRSRKNMCSVLEMVKRGTTAEGPDPSAPLKAYIRSLGENHPAYGPASDFLSDGGVTVAGKNVLSTLLDALSIFNDEGIRSLTCRSDVPVEEIVRRKTVVYIGILEDGDPYQPIAAAFINQWYRVATLEANSNGGRLPRPAVLLGDELGNVGKIECLGQIASLGRSMGVKAVVCVQDLGQLEAYNNYGDNGAGKRKILGSIGGKVALSLSNPEDCAYFTKLCGKRAVRTRNISEQGFGGKAGRTHSEVADDLIHEWEWPNRVPIRDGVICIKTGENRAPGREGIFKMPLTHASNTPARDFFGLGTEEEDRAKRADFRKRKEEAIDAAGGKRPPEVWHPDFTAFSMASQQDPIIADEMAAWGLM